MRVRAVYFVQGAAIVAVGGVKQVYAAVGRRANKAQLHIVQRVVVGADLNRKGVYVVKLFEMNSVHVSRPEPKIKTFSVHVEVAHSLLNDKVLALSVVGGADDDFILLKQINFSARTTDFLRFAHSAAVHVGGDSQYFPVGADG